MPISTKCCFPKAKTSTTLGWQAEAMVAEWKELLWDVQTERAALWGHCQALFVRHSFPALQAGTFFLKHADVVERDVSTLELQSILLLAFQWLSGSLTNSSPQVPHPDSFRPVPSTYMV